MLESAANCAEGNSLLSYMDKFMKIVGEPHYDVDILTKLEQITIKNEMKLILIMMNSEEGSLSAECNGDANAINIVETMKFKIAAISIHDDVETKKYYEFYEELGAILYAAEEAKEIKIDMLVKDDIHVDVVSDINIDISLRNINVEFYPQGRSSYEQML